MELSVEKSSFHLLVDRFRVTDGVLPNGEGSSLKLLNPVYLGGDPSGRNTKVCSASAWPHSASVCRRLSSVLYSSTRATASPRAAWSDASATSRWTRRFSGMLSPATAPCPASKDSQRGPTLAAATFSQVCPAWCILMHHEDIFFYFSDHRVKTKLAWSLTQITFFSRNQLLCSFPVWLGLWAASSASDRSSLPFLEWQDELCCLHEGNWGKSWMFSNWRTAPHQTATICNCQHYSTRWLWKWTMERVWLASPWLLGKPSVMGSFILWKVCLVVFITQTPCRSSSFDDFLLSFLSVQSKQRTPPRHWRCVREESRSCCITFKLISSALHRRYECT